MLCVRRNYSHVLRTSNTRSLHSTFRRRSELFDPTNVERAEDEVDVCIVGGGPAGLSAAIRLKQLEQEKGREIRVIVLEKGGEVGELLLLNPPVRGHAKSIIVSISQMIWHTCSDILNIVYHAEHISCSIMVHLYQLTY